MTVHDWQQRQNASAGRSLLLGLFIGAAAWAGSAAAEEATEPPPKPPLEALFAPLKERVSTSALPDFFKDTEIKIQFRSYYFNREKPDGTENEAWTFGGWFSYKSGWLLETFGIGATFYGSAGLYAPDDKDGTLLLKPGQESYYVLGEAYAALRYDDYVLLKGYRQLVNLVKEKDPRPDITQPDHPYINPQDNRMTPITYEAITAWGRVGLVQYLAGYLWKIKQRNSDEFVSMAEQAGAASSDDGVIFGTVRLLPMTGVRVELSEQYGINTFNTLYAEGEYLLPLTQDWKLRFGAQFTDQRAVGDELINNAAEKNWSTQSGGARVQAIFQNNLTLMAAFSITGSGNTIQTPWGSFPGYLSLIDQDFDRANEKAIGVGAAFNFSKLVTEGLGASFNIAYGWDAINPSTRADAPDQTEYDLTIDYRPPFKTPAFLQGMWLRVRGAILDQENADQLGWQVRMILNWERDLL
jgi:hypothetical protein